MPRSDKYGPNGFAVVLSMLPQSWAPLQVQVSQADGRLSLMDVHSLGKGAIIPVSSAVVVLPSCGVLGR